MAPTLVVARLREVVEQVRFVAAQQRPERSVARDLRACPGSDESLLRISTRLVSRFGQIDPETIHEAPAASLRPLLRWAAK